MWRFIFVWMVAIYLRCQRPVTKGMNSKVSSKFGVANLEFPTLELLVKTLDRTAVLNVLWKESKPRFAEFYCKPKLRDLGGPGSQGLSTSSIVLLESEKGQIGHHSSLLSWSENESGAVVSLKFPRRMSRTFARHLKTMLIGSYLKVNVLVSPSSSWILLNFQSLKKAGLLWKEKQLMRLWWDEDCAESPQSEGWRRKIRLRMKRKVKRREE